ncbi:MAG TPA: acetylxylan esterase [Acidimicrobiales bacterium]|nr:acetylxylan esterase [Acidimicrobiales bacterium]
MRSYDLPRDELLEYSPELPGPPDLELFWSTTLDESRSAAHTPAFNKVETGLALVDTFDVTFSGFGGHLIRGWLHLPAALDAPVPAVVRFQGYGGGRGSALEVSTWALAGYAAFIMDTRGQGSSWSPGDTPDPVGSAPSHPGFMTRGVLNPRDYYYRRLFADAVLAVEAVRAHPMVQADKVAVTGASQGGGLALAVAALGRDLWAVMADVPFLCDFRRAIEIVDTDPYDEIVRYLRVHRDHTDIVFSTLAYFDAARLAKLAKAPALFSVGLMDEVCPPSTVYAAYNRYGGPKRIVEYPFNEHEGGQWYHQAVQLEWLRSLDRSGGS